MQALTGAVLVSPMASFTALATAALSWRRRYVDGPFGQVHLYQAMPARLEDIKYPPLACFHPTAVSGDFYRAYMTEMARDRIVYALDTPGYGKSDPPPEPTSIERLAESTAAALEALGYGAQGGGAVDVMGYHTGVFIACDLAVQRPDLVRRLVLPGISYYPEPLRTEKYSEYAKPSPENEEGAYVMKVWEFWVGQRSDGVSLERGAEHVADMLQAGPRAWWAYHSVFSYDADARLPLVRQPVLIPNSHGGLADNSRQAAQLFPDAKLVELPHLKHGIFDTAAVELADLTRQFLAKG
jgi:pimeloyl-ACP methyl ester carboxylesterase